MGYTNARWPKVATGMIVAGIVAAAATAYYWHFPKERYFDFMSTSCGEAHGLEHIPWQRVPAFDARVEEFTARSPSETAMVECIDRWAGAIISDDVAAGIDGSTIQFRAGGEIYAPPKRLVSYHLTRPVD